MGDTQDIRPRRESVEFFIQVISGHSNVTELIPIDYQIYRITRKRGKDLLVYLTNIYMIGIADYIEIRKQFLNVNCIITVSNWNKYTEQAKERAIEERIGLFNISEFMGALNIESFWLYDKKDSGGSANRKWGR